METSLQYKTLFMGTPEFAVPILQVLIDHPAIQLMGVVTQPDKVAGRNKTPQPSAIKKLAHINNIEVYTPDRIKKNTEFLQQLETMELDLIVVAAYGKILPKELLDLPKYGALNIHGSVLPKYRGASPISAAILAGDNKTGVTLMQMDMSMDTGAIVAISPLADLEPSDTTSSLSQRLSLVGANLLEEKLIPYLKGGLAPQKQDDNKASYTKLLQKIDGKIDWTKDAIFIERQIRAFIPWPSAYTFWDGKRIKILKAILTIEDISLTPGEVSKNTAGLIVGTGGGNLLIQKLQLEGKQPTNGLDFIKGYQKIIGTTLE